MALGFVSPKPAGEDFSRLDQLAHAPLPNLEHIGIEEVKYRRRHELDNPFAAVYEGRYAASDGTVFKDLTAVALNPTCEFVVSNVPAWFTSYDRGFVKRNNDKLNERGRHTHTTDLPTNRFTDLYRNAHYVHLALDEVGHHFGDKIDTSTVDAHGDSNGDMTEVGVIAQGPQRGRQVRKAFLVDGCVVERPGLYEARKLARRPEYIPKEVFTLCRQLFRLLRDEPGDIIEYIKTVTPTPEYIAKNFYLARALFWGEYGHLLAHMPDDQEAHLRLFEHSVANQKNRTLYIVKGADGKSRPNVTTDVIPGTHLSIANARTQADKFEYLSSGYPAAA